MLHCNGGLTVVRVSLRRATSLATKWKSDSMQLEISNLWFNPQTTYDGNVACIQLASSLHLALNDSIIC